MRGLPVAEPHSFESRSPTLASIRCNCNLGDDMTRNRYGEVWEFRTDRFRIVLEIERQYKYRYDGADDVRGEVWSEDTARWYYNLPDDAGGNWGNGPWPSRAIAEQACLMAWEREDWRKRLECTEARLRERLKIAESAALASADLELAMNVVCSYRGPCGERYNVRLLSASEAK